MSRNVSLVIVVILVLLIGGWFVMRSKSTTPTPATTPATTVESAPTPQATSTPAASEGAVMKTEKLVTITTAGFTPKDITIKAGENVTWMNSDTIDHTVNSAPHPTHTIYPPLNLNTIKPGEKKSLTFPTAGTFKYHDHLNPSLFGSVTVQ